MMKFVASFRLNSYLCGFFSDNCVQMKFFEFRPKLCTVFKDYSKATFLSDLMAGIIVGIVALPLAIAFGIASGVAP